MQKLPIGIQTFSDLRNDGYLYVDKTEDIHRMITSGKPFFLSRPRRFGKSLLVSTLEEIFKGNKALFEGLFIYDHWDWTRQHPVIRLDFGAIANYSSEALSQSLADFVSSIASEQKIILEKTETPDRFSELIKKMHLSAGSQVAVLIDEYDNPIIDNMSNAEVLNENKRILHDFYKVLKVADQHLCFIFLTGVSKFAGMSLFSGLNNLNDITNDDRYASICGYTQTEFEHYFSEHLDEFARKKSLNKLELLDEIRYWYNGFSWDGSTLLYNPFSTLSFFDKMRFDNYWFRSGTPTFLIETLKKQNRLESVIEPITVSSKAFDSFDPEKISETSLLFQTGYLTIKHIDDKSIPTQYTLHFPNNEVKESLFEYLLNAYSGYPLEKEQELKQRMRQQLLNNVASKRDEWQPY